MRFFAPVQTSPRDHPACYTVGTGSSSGIKRPWRGLNHPLPSSAEVKEIVEIYLYSPLCAFMAGYRVNFTFIFTNRTKIPFSNVKLWAELSDWTQIPCISTVACKQAYWKHNASFKTVLNACDTSETRWEKEFKSSGTWHFIVCWEVSDVTQELGAFSFRGLTGPRTAVWFLRMPAIFPFEESGTTYRSHNVPSYATWLSRNNAMRTWELAPNGDLPVGSYLKGYETHSFRRMLTCFNFNPPTLR